MIDASQADVIGDVALEQQRDDRAESALPREDLWAIVLAGGEGVRLRPLVRRVLGDERPKQYAPLLGVQSLLSQTLDRVGLAVPVRQTVVVTMSQHAGYIADEFARRERPVVIAQPCDRGTAAAILYPAHRIAWSAPDATVAVFPSDHLVADEAAFMAHVAEIARWVALHPEQTVLLGAQPTSAEVEYGWIEPAECLGEVPSGTVHAVRKFWEKPSLVTASTGLAAGHLWNTSVVVAKVSTLLALGRAGLPDAVDRLARIRVFTGTPDEGAAVHQAYRLLPKANFSRAILEACPDQLAVSRMPRVGWTDLGSPRRVVEAASLLTAPPAWARDLAPLD